MGKTIDDVFKFDLKAHNSEEMSRWQSEYDRFCNEHSDYFEWLTELEMRTYFTLEVYQPHK